MSEHSCDVGVCVCVCVCVCAWVRVHVHCAIGGCRRTDIISTLLKLPYRPKVLYTITSRETGKSADELRLLHF